METCVILYNPLGCVKKLSEHQKVRRRHALTEIEIAALGAMPGVDPKSVQTLMRHSDPRLKFGVYVHSNKNRLRDAVAALPERKPSAIKAPDNVAVKTGTDDRDVDPDDDGPNGGEPIPTSGQQVKTGHSRKAQKGSALQTGQDPALNHRVGGSSPPGRIQQNPRTTLQGTAPTSITVDAASSLKSGSDCTGLHANTLTLHPKSTSNQQGKTRVSPVPTQAALSPELQKIMSRWPKLPENIRMAILALIDISK